jgi:hypothetical protein
MTPQYFYFCTTIHGMLIAEFIVKLYLQTYLKIKNKYPCKTK